MDNVRRVHLNNHARRVLVYRLGSLGDTLIALPSFHLIARAFPAAERRLLTNLPVAAKAPPAAAVLEHTGLIHGYMRYTTGTRSIRELLRLAAAIRRFRPNVLVYLTGARGLDAARRDSKFSASPASAARSASRSPPPRSSTSSAARFPLLRTPTSSPKPPASPATSPN
jgi:hypothetical protein